MRTLHVCNRLLEKKRSLVGLVVAQMVGGSTPGPCSLHAEVSLGEILNTDLLPAAEEEK